MSRSAGFVALDRHDIGHTAESFLIGIGQGEEVGVHALVVQHIVFRYAELVERFAGNGIAGGPYVIIVLSSRCVPVRFAVDVELAMLHGHRIARHAHTAFYIVFPLVGRVGDDGVLPVEEFPAALLAVGVLKFAEHIVIGDVGVLHEYRIPGRKVEHHDVVAPHFAASGQTLIRAANRFRIGFLRLRQRHPVVHQRKREGSHRHSWTVRHLAYAEIIADQQRFFHRRGGNSVHLEDVGMDKRRHDHGKHDGFDPAPHFTIGFVGRLAFPMLLPEQESRDVFGDVDVEDDRQSQQHPRIARPHHEP